MKQFNDYYNVVYDESGEEVKNNISNFECTTT